MTTQNHSDAIWTHYNPVKIIAGENALLRLSDLITKGHVLLVCTAGSQHRGTAERVSTLMTTCNVTTYDQVTPNPDIDGIDQATQNLRNNDITSIVALGGGSVIDTAKALAWSLPAKQPTFLDSTFRKGISPPADVQCLPIIAIPTTAGTGSEVTFFSTVWDHTHNRKYSLADEKLYPHYAILDPELTLSLPPKETLHSGLDAISHALESLWNKNRTPCSESFALQALRLIYRAFPDVLQDPENRSARANMQYASMLAGQAISQTRTAIAHAISYPLTLHFGMPHGLACSFTLTNIWKEAADAYPHLNLPEIRHIITLLESLNLPQEISAYIPDGILPQTMLDEMHHPDRIGNFILHTNATVMEKVVQGALSPTP